MLSVVQISFFEDPLKREPAELLRVWPTLVDLAEAAASAGVTVTVVQASAHRACLSCRGIDFHFLPIQTQNDDALAALLQQLQPAVLHVQGLSFSREVLALAGLMPGVPILLQDHADRPPRKPWAWLTRRRALSRARGLIFCDRRQARPFARARLIGAGTRLYELPESSSRFMPRDCASTCGDGPIRDSPALLWVGHLNANKDPLTVLEGLALAAQHLPDVQLWCCWGSAPLLAEVQARVKVDPRLKDRVHLLGPQPHQEIERLMGAADFLVQGSHSESTGYTVLEALACGLPPLVTDIPSFRSLTADGAVGGLWPCGDARALSQTLQRLWQQPQAPLRAAARAHFEAELSLGALGRKLRAVYEDALQP